MTLQIALLLLIIVAALIFFSFEWVSSDVIALGVLLLLVLTGLLPSKQAFTGFGSDTVIMILGLLILTAALMRTGVVDLVGRLILRHTGDSPSRLVLVLMLASAGLSSLMSNTAATAFFVPMVMGVAKNAKISAAKLLMPVAFAAILSSSVTLISTSTNIVVSGLMTHYELKPISMFELSPVGVPIALVGVAYMFLIGKWLVPDRTPPEDLTTAFGVRPFLTEVLILPTSSLVGKTLAEAGLGRDFGLTVLRIVRKKNQYLSPRSDAVLEAEDVLLVEGKREDLLKIQDAAGIDIKADVKLSDPNLESENVGLVECILLPKSPLIGRTLKSFGFRERYGLQVLGINRHGENIRRKLSQISLRMGDVLLLQGDRRNIAALQDDDTFRILSSVDQKRPHLRRAPYAITIFIGVLLLGTFAVPLSVAVMLGALLVFVTRCITPAEAYREIEWKAIILIGSMLGLGEAMDHTGTAKYLAGLIIKGFGTTEPIWILSGFFALTVLLTQPMSNQAAAVVVLPVAIHAAIQLGLDPRAFAIMIAVAASCSYLTPLEPSCLMVYGPGRYRFVDFLKVGSPLTLLIFLIAILLVPKFWPLQP